MNRSLAMLASVLVVAFTGSLCAAVPNVRSLVHVDLLADPTALANHHQLVVGVRLKIEPGWHTYWKNPGDAGVPTVVKFELPDGFKTGELQFPTPQIISEPGGITIYGYENEVVFTTTISVPPNWDMTLAIPIHANVNFLVCKDICLPGVMEAVMSVDPKSIDEKSVSEIGLWNKSSPTPIHIDIQQDSPMSFTVRGKLSEFDATAPLSFIPGPGDSFLTKCEPLERQGDSFVAKIAIEPFPGQAVLQKQLECLITQKLPNDDRPRGLSFTVPLAANSATSRP